MSIYQKLAVTVAGLALGLAVTEATPAQAATITYDFTFTLSSGQGSLQSSVDNEYSGSFSYDDSKISYSDPRLGGLGYITLPSDFSLNFNNINYTKADLVPYGRGRGGTLLEFTKTEDSYQLEYFSLVTNNSGKPNTYNLNIFERLSNQSQGVFVTGNEGAGYGSLTKVTQACY